jgi:hypothetical protein
MPIRDDFILRMLDQVAEAIAHVLTGRGPVALPLAEQELASAYLELTGSSRALVASLSSEQLLAILGAPARFHRERGYVLARLLEADAALIERSGAEGGADATGPAVTGPAVTDPAVNDGAATDMAATDMAAADGSVADTTAGDAAAADAAVARLKALDLYLEAAKAGLDEEDLEERLARLLSALADLQIPAGSHWRVFEHAAAEGRYAVAEDLLFEGLERFGAGRDVAERGRSFYRTLEALPDAELAAGALPRSELGEGRAAFEGELRRAPQQGAE